LAANAGLAANITVTAEKTYAQERFADRIVDYGIFRDAVTDLWPNVPESSAVYVPLTELTQNLDSTARGSTAELLRIDFYGNIETLGPVGDADTLFRTDDGGLLIETDHTLARRDLSSGEEVWKIALPTVDGEVAGVSLSKDGAIYVVGDTQGEIEKLDVLTGAKLATIRPDPAVGSNWGVAQALYGGQILLFGDNRYSLVNEQGAVLWQAGKVYPNTSYGSAALVGDDILLNEYVSASNPDPALQRRTIATLIDASGKELWSRVDKARFLAQNTEALYFQQYGAPGSGSLIAIDRSTGKLLWSTPLPQLDVYLSAVADHDKVVVGSQGGVFVLAAADGSISAARTWPGRTMTKILSVNGATIIATSESAAEPNDTYVTHLRVE
jgi:outer membrane protein assembly factor BamB